MDSGEAGKRLRGDRDPGRDDGSWAGDTMEVVEIRFGMYFGDRADGIS